MRALDRIILSKKQHRTESRDPKALKLQPSKSKYRSASTEENKDIMDVNVVELKYIEDESNEVSNYFKYKIVTRAKGLSRYQDDKEYVVYRKFKDFELFHSSFT